MLEDMVSTLKMRSPDELHARNHDGRPSIQWDFYNNRIEQKTIITCWQK